MAKPIDALGQVFSIEPLAYARDARAHGADDRVVVRLVANDERHCWSAEHPAFAVRDLHRFASVCADMADSPRDGVFAGAEPDLEVSFASKDGDITMVVTFDEAVLPPGVTTAGYQIRYVFSPTRLREFADDLHGESTRQAEMVTP